MQHRPLSKALQDLATAQRLKKLLGMFIVISILMFVGFTLNSYERVARHAVKHLDQMSETMVEHAVKLLETHEVILDRVLELAGDARTAALRADEARMHDALVRITGRYRQIRNATLWDEEGRPVFSSRYYPVPVDVTIADCSCFTRHKAGDVALSMNEPVTGRLGGERVYSMSKSRMTVDGSFGGMASTSLSPQYLAEVYRRVVGQEKGLAVALMTPAGELVARHPPVESAAHPAGHPLRSALMEGREYGILSDIAGLDGQRRHVSFRKIPSYPLYIAVSLDTWTVVSEWRHDLAAVASFVLPALVILGAAMWLAWRRAETEHRALLQAQAEAEKRAGLEEQVHHLEKFEALGHLTSGLAHDFNNLLHVVSTNAAAIRLLPPGFDAQPHVSAMERAVTRGQSLIKHMLGFAHKKKFRLECVKPSSVLPDMCELAKHSLPKTIALRCVIDPAAWNIAVDRSELELALMNLAVNARDAMPGGGEITVLCRNVPMGSEERVTAGLAPKHFVAVSMADTGTGIPEHLLQRVFDPLFTTKKASKGTGLGLSRVQSYATQLGGRAIATNAPGAGAVITIYIPASDTSPDTELPHFGGIEIRETAPRVAVASTESIDTPPPHG